MSALFLTAFFFTQSLSAPSIVEPLAEKASIDRVFLDDYEQTHRGEIGEVHLLSGKSRAAKDTLYIAKVHAKKRGNHGRKKHGGRNHGGSGFQMGAFGVGSHGVSPGGRKFGIGLQLGFPTALTIKYMLTADQGIVAGIGFGTGWIAQALSLHLDYLYHPNVIVRGPPFVLSWYFGGGLWLGLADRGTNAFIRGINYGYYPVTPVNIWLGARLPIGINLAFRELPIELYLEGVPALVFFPRITFAFGFTVGARFYF